MTKVLQKTTVTGNTSTVSSEVYKVAFWAIVALAIGVGVVSFAALGVGIFKAVLLALA